MFNKSLMFNIQRTSYGQFVQMISVLLIFMSCLQQGVCKEENLAIQNLVDSNSTSSESNNLYNDQSNVSDLQEFQSLLVQYVNGAINRNLYEIVEGINAENENETRKSRYSRADFDAKTFDESLMKTFLSIANTAISRSESMEKGKAVNEGRLFFFKGLKKVLWPVFIGFQVIKTILLFLFLPSIIGSLGKIVGKGLSSVSGLSQPMTHVDDLEYKDNSYNTDQDFNSHDGYTYMQGTQSDNLDNYDAESTNNVLHRLGYGGNRVTYVNSPINYSKHKISTSYKRDDFKKFHDIPSSSLLLTNYDPFYSPLLSRIDSIFHQLHIPKSEERCREKLICLMYANPAKYAPYSNLISAQLSRELNELRKPSNDNPEILRFFKYMRSAKDGQDGVNCEEQYKECENFKDSTNPAMVTTFNDINKLVQARKI